MGRAAPILEVACDQNGMGCSCVSEPARYAVFKRALNAFQLDSHRSINEHVLLPHLQPRLPH